MDRREVSPLHNPTDSSEGISKARASACSGRNDKLAVISVKIEGEDGDVVGLRTPGGVAGKFGDGVEQTRDQIGGGKIPVCLQELFAAFFSELFLGSACGFDQAVREKQATRAKSDWEFPVEIFGFGKKAEHEPAFRKFDDGRRVFRSKQLRRMARGSITQNPFLQIYKKIGGGDEVFFELATKSAVKSGENESGIMGVRS